MRYGSSMRLVFAGLAHETILMLTTDSEGMLFVTTRYQLVAPSEDALDLRVSHRTPRGILAC